MVAIKRMEMPRCCAECDMCLCLDDDYSGLCHITQTTNMNRANSRNSDCPLVEIVTCKNCKYNYENSCDFDGFGIDDDYFCAKGERKEK